MKNILPFILLGFSLSLFSQVPASGLVASWPFNGNANDMTGSNNGTVTGASLIGDRCGNANSAYHFNGTTDFIKMLSAGPTGTVSRSLSYWVRSSYQGLSPIASFDYGTPNGNGDAFQMVYNYNCIGTGIDVSNAALIRGNACLMNGTWHHVVAVYNSSVSTQVNAVNFYIDGVLQPVIACNVSGTTAVINTGNFPITIGRATNSAIRYFQGDLDDFYLYNRPLTQQEVLQLYTSCSLMVSGPSNLCVSGTAVYSIAPVSGASYTWNLPNGWTGTSGSNTILVTSAANTGTISVTYSLSNCSYSAVAVKPVTIGALTISAVPAKTNICNSETNTLVATGGVSYTWQPGSLTGGNVVVNPTITTIYTVTGTDGSACTNTSIVTVSVSPDPTISAVSGSSIICKGEGSILTGSGGSLYTWQPGSLTGGNVVVNPTITTAYTVTGTDGPGCTNTNVITVSVQAASSVSAALSSSIICEGESATLTASGGSLYAWQPGGSVNPVLTVNPLSTTIYTLSGTVPNCTNTSVSTLSLFVEKCTGIKETYTNSSFFSLYPNPSSGKFSISLNLTSSVKIINGLGELIYINSLASGEHFIDISGQPGGVYFVQVSQQNRLKTVKLIKD